MAIIVGSVTIAGGGAMAEDGTTARAAGGGTWLMRNQVWTGTIYS